MPRAFSRTAPRRRAAPSPTDAEIRGHEASVDAVVVRRLRAQRGDAVESPPETEPEPPDDRLSGVLFF